MELGMWDRRAVYDRLVVTKHICFLVDRDTQIVQGVPEINGRINANTSSDKLGPVCGGFDGCLLLGVPVDGGLVGKVKNASYRSPRNHIMV